VSKATITVTTEVEIARRMLPAIGIAPERIVYEDRSRNTHENAQFTRDMLNPGADEIWLLVTSAWHMPRSMGVFRAAGFPVVPYPVDYTTFGAAGDFRAGFDLDDGATRAVRVCTELNDKGRDDALFSLLNVPSGVGGATQDAGWLGAGRVKATITRFATAAEKVFATGTGTTGTPGVLAWAINGYAFKSDRAKMVKVMQAWPV
jgi:hypothetical protein